MNHPEVVLKYQTRGEITKPLVSQMPQNEFGQQVVARITIVEYALSDIHKPMGVSEYQLTQSLPDDLNPSLPRKEIEKELGRGDDE